MWQRFLDLIVAYKLGDLASIVGVAISIVGFVLTVWGVLKSRKAAERAEAAATAARDSIRIFDTTVDFASAITTLEELRRAHRAGQWPILPDRYAAVRKLLINVRASNPGLSEQQNKVIQQSLANLAVLEQTVERGLVAKSDPANPAKLNQILSQDIDELVAIFAELKMKNTGG